MTSEGVMKRFRAIYKEPKSNLGADYFDPEWAVELMNDSVDDIETDVSLVNPEYFGGKTGSLGSPSTNGGYKADEQEYDLPADFRKVIKVRVVDRGGPPYPTLGEINYSQRDLYFNPDGLPSNWHPAGGKGEPSAYYIYRVQGETNATIGFVSIPSRNGSVNGVEIIYHSTRGSVAAIDDTAGNTPDLPPDWHPLIPWRMAMNAAALDERPSFVYYQANYQGRLAKIMGEGLRGQGEGQEQIEMTDWD